MTESAVASADLPRSAYLTHTLRRARTAAEQRSHRYVMLEHLLLALLDDPDAQRAMALVNADAALLRSAIAEAVNHRMATLVSPGNAPPSFSYKFELVMQNASADAMRLGRREVDGGLVIVALARDTDSFAGASLQRFGLDPVKTFSALSSGYSASSTATVNERRVAPPSPRSAPAYLPPGIVKPQPAGPAPASRPAPPPNDASMEDMLASVREMLEQEERKLARSGPPGEMVTASRAPAPAPHAPRPPAAPAPAQPSAARTAPPARAQDAAAPRNLPVPAADAGRRRAADEAVAGKLVENIPRAMRVAIPEIVELRLSREQSAELFEGLKGRGEAQTHDVTVTRAMTVRLRAPAGGFFIETLSPETQWVFDRPSFLGAEPFGRWVWTVIPNERGKHRLQVIVSARNIDEKGLTGDVALPDQIIDIKVRTNYRRAFAQIFRGVLLLLAGGALTEGALYLARMYFNI